MTKASPICNRCNDTGWVCENHDDRVWYGLMPDDHERCCKISAGMPCVCNKMDENGDPTKTGFKSVYINKNGVNQ